MKEQIPVWVQILISLGGLLVPMALFYWRLQVDKAKDKKTLEDSKAKEKVDFEAAQIKKEEERDIKEDQRIAKQNRFFSERITELELKVTSIDDKVDNIEKKIDNHIGDSDFKVGFQNKISDLSITLLRASDLDSEYKRVLNYYFVKIEKICIDFYYSPLRKKEKKRLENALLENFELFLGEFNQYIDMTIKELRYYNNNEHYSLSQFLEKTSFFGKSRVLINVLIVNGFDTEDKFLNLVTNHLDTFYSDFIQMLRVWRRLKRMSMFGHSNEEEEAA
jgi:hypothetical protein